MTQRHLRKLSKVIPFDKQYGYGVDLIVQVQNQDSSGTELWLVEIKSCYLDVNDVYDALRQFQVTEQVLQNQKNFKEM